MFLRLKNKKGAMNITKALAQNLLSMVRLGKLKMEKTFWKVLYMVDLKSLRLQILVYPSFNIGVKGDKPQKVPYDGMDFKLGTHDIKLKQWNNNIKNRIT